MIRIGKIVAVHGLKGNVIMTHVANKSNWLKSNIPLFVAINKGSQVPYFVEQFTVRKNDEYLVKFEDVDTPEQAKFLQSKEVFVPYQLLKDAKIDSPLLWIGFKVNDKCLGDIGILLDISQTGFQWVGELAFKNKNRLIPFVEPILLKVDTENQIIYVDLPEGILEL